MIINTDIVMIINIVISRKLRFGQILLFSAKLQETSIKTQFCDQRNWPIINVIPNNIIVNNIPNVLKHLVPMKSGPD